MRFWSPPTCLFHCWPGCDLTIARPIPDSGLSGPFSTLCENVFSSFLLYKKSGEHGWIKNKEGIIGIVPHGLLTFRCLTKIPKAPFSSMTLLLSLPAPPSLQPLIPPGPCPYHSPIDLNFSPHHFAILKWYTLGLSNGLRTP